MSDADMDPTGRIALGIVLAYDESPRVTVSRELLEKVQAALDRSAPAEFHARREAGR